jgi:hypothetical protein
MIKPCIAIFLIVLLALPLPAADSSPAALWRWFARSYVAQPVRPVDLTNTPRIRQLLRAGNIYLSLSDAIALAIENNLDIELQRYGQPMADSDLLRAKGGGLLRGLLYNLAEVPVGMGGPASPLVTGGAAPNIAGGSVPTNPSELGVLVEPQDNLSIEGTIPLSNGPMIPLFDPALVYQLNWTHQTTPQTNPFVVGASALRTDTTLANGEYVQGFGPGTELNVAYDNSRQTLNSFRTSYSPYTSTNLASP